MEELKTMPFGAVWEYYCVKQDVPVMGEWVKEMKKYEEDVLSKRS
jgi:L-rhamnose isomerase